VVLGSRAFAHHAVASIPRGVYLAKSMRSLSERMFELLRKLGHEIVAWDEEGLVRFSDPDYYRRRISPRALAQVSMLFAWGEGDAELFRKYPGNPGIPVRVTGNPRIDLTRPELRSVFDEDVRDIRARFGRFLLVDTNFSFVNAFVESLNLLTPATPDGGSTLGRNARDMTPEFARGVAAHKEALFAHFKQLLPLLSEVFPELRIVVRPHPAETHAPWKQASAGLDNVHVVNEGSVLPWLVSAEATLHNGCTTAIESAVLGTPVIAYQPIASERFDLALPNSLSLRARNPNELLAMLKPIVAGEPATVGTVERERILEQHLAALTGPLAADRMVDALVDAGYLEGCTGPSPLGHRLLGRLQLRLRTTVKSLNRRRRDHRNSNAFHAHRFPGVTPEALLNRVEQFTAQLDRFHGVRIERASSHVFRIRS